MNEYPPSSEQGETASNRGGIGNPPFFVTRMQCVDPGARSGVLLQKSPPKWRAGDVVSLDNDYGHHMKRLSVIKGAA